MELKDILAGKSPEEQTAWLREHMPDWDEFVAGIVRISNSNSVPSIGSTRVRSREARPAVFCSSTLALSAAPNRKLFIVIARRLPSLSSALDLNRLSARVFWRMMALFASLRTTGSAKPLIIQNSHSFSMACCSLESRKRSTSLARDYGTNLLGAMLGGVGEYLSLVTGFRVLLFLIAACYIGALLARAVDRDHLPVVGRAGDRRAVHALEALGLEAADAEGAGDGVRDVGRTARNRGQPDQHPAHVNRDVCNLRAELDQGDAEVAFFGGQTGVPSC